MAKSTVSTSRIGKECNSRDYGTGAWDSGSQKDLVVYCDGFLKTIASEFPFLPSVGLQSSFQQSKSENIQRV